MINSISKINKNIIKVYNKFNIFDNKYILNNIEKRLNYEFGDYEWNIIIPFYNRYSNLTYLINNLKEKVSPKIKVIISVVEISEIPTLLNFQEETKINYIWIDKKKLGNCFNKCLCGNICYKLYKKKYNYKYILWHDVDCIVQDGFVNKILEKLDDTSCVQTFPFRYVLYTKINYANKIRNNEIDVNKIVEKQEGIEPVKAGAPGGSIIIPFNIFKKMKLFNTNIFYNYSCEDAFILYKLSKFSNIKFVDYDNNYMIHLWHELLSDNPINKNSHFYFQELYFSLIKNNNIC
jgi:hypothetical protein